MIACGSSGSLISLICWGIFIFFTAEIALVGAAESPACKAERSFYNASTVAHDVSVLGTMYCPALWWILFDMSKLKLGLVVLNSLSHLLYGSAIIIPIYLPQINIFQWKLTDT